MLTPSVGRPHDAAVREAILAHLPQLVDEPVKALGDGWAFSAFLVGETVLRFPRKGEFAANLAVEAAIMRELAPTLPLPVPVISVHHDGPAGLPFTSHHLVPGVAVQDLQRPLAANAGETLGQFLRAMHAFPVERAAALGLADPSPIERREQRRQWFEEQIAGRVFARVSKEAREHLSRTFRAILAKPASFDWQAVLSHNDLDGRNVLADPNTGEITGVIDWGDIGIHDAAGDFTDVLFGSLGNAGLSDQLPSLLATYGITEAELDAMRPRCRFYEYCWPLHEIIYGLDTNNEAFIRSGIDFLDAAIGEYEGDP